MNNVSDRANWAQLFRIACELIRQANSKQVVIEHWTFGGGTALMLQLDHRESHDIDIFLNDPQQLPFLDPQKQDFKSEVQPDAYEGDGVRSLKLIFGIGEIDFIVASSLTSFPTIRSQIEGENVQLDTIPEIITKKVFYRGFSVMPRDVFDIAAAGKESADVIVQQLRPYKAQVTQTLAAMEKLNPEFGYGSFADLINTKNSPKRHLRQARRYFGPSNTVAPS